MNNDNNSAADDVQSLHDLHRRAMQAYAAWQDAEERRDEDTWEAETYAYGLKRGFALDPSVLSPPAPVGAVDAAREAYCRAYDEYWAAIDSGDDVGDNLDVGAAYDDLPDPAREATKPLAWLDPINDRIVTEMTNRAIYATYPTFGPPPAEFTVAEFYEWDERYHILLVNGDDSPDDGPINIDECLAAGAIKAVDVKVGGTDQRLYMVQPGFYHHALGFLHPGR